MPDHRPVMKQMVIPARVGGAVATDGLADQEYIMRRIRVWAGVTVLAGSVLLVTVALAQEKKLSPQDIPAKVADAVKARLPGAQITSAEKENEKGNIVYDL